MKRIVMIVGLLLIVLGLHSADAKPLPKVGEALRLKFEKGRDYYLEVKTMTVQKMNVMGQEVRQEQGQIFVLRISPETRLPDNDWLVGVNVIGARMKVDISGNPIAYDTAKPDPQSPLAPLFDALVKTKFQATMAPNGEMKKLEGRNQLLKALNNLPAGQEGLMKSLLTEESLKKMFMPMGEYLPDRAERVGAFWVRQGRVDVGPIGQYAFEHRFTYHDTIGSVHEIRAATSMKYQAPEVADPNLPFKITGVTMKKSDGKGSYQFDADLGRLRESTQEQRFAASMKISIGGMDSEVDLDQTQTTKVRSLDKNPLAK